jgi:hypothetical protein
MRRLAKGEAFTKTDKHTQAIEGTTVLRFPKLVQVFERVEQADLE